ncbi:hypothetical protein OF83DRAFT_285422 [Amylostereum chailletii]|nr:hypothetical protein OF83DRAFT_285422 [Amylostereum chailletii]
MCRVIQPYAVFPCGHHVNYRTFVLSDCHVPTCVKSTAHIVLAMHDCRSRCMMPEPEQRQEDRFQSCSICPPRPSRRSHHPPLPHTSSFPCSLQHPHSSATFARYSGEVLDYTGITNSQTPDQESRRRQDTTNRFHTDSAPNPRHRKHSKSTQSIPSGDSKSRTSKHGKSSESSINLPHLYPSSGVPIATRQTSSAAPPRSTKAHDVRVIPLTRHETQWRISPLEAGCYSLSNNRPPYRPFLSPMAY